MDQCWVCEFLHTEVLIYFGVSSLTSVLVAVLYVQLWSILGPCAMGVAL